MNYIENIQQFATPQNTFYALGAVATIYVANKVIKNWKIKARYRYLKNKGRQARESRDNYIKTTQIPDHGISQELQNKILVCSLKELKKMLDDQLFTSEQLLNFYAKRMHTIGFEHKLITQSNYTAALARAKQLDNIRKNHPDQVKGELFGIVVTIKDTFDLKGLASTIGCFAKIDQVPKEDGLFVQIFQNAGAIFFAKTNIPQVAMAVESINNLWGTAENPWNKKRSCGGSSGGSGGSIAAKVSPLCFGSDIGGSIRVPSNFNGVTGLKPTSRRISVVGHTYYSDAQDGQTSCPLSVGPISRYVDDCALAMEAYLNKANYSNIKKSKQDLYLSVKSWDQQEYKSTRKLKVGYYKAFDFYPAVDAVQRGVQIAIDALRKQGHEVVEITPPCVPEMLDATLKLLLSDSGKGFMDVLDGEEPLKFYQDLLGLYNSTDLFRSALSKFLTVMGEHRLSNAVKGSHGVDSYDYRKLTYQAQQYRQKYIELMEEQQLDGIVSPSFGVVSGEHGFTFDLLLPFVYACIYNLLDFPAGITPVTVVKENEQDYKDNFNDTVTKLTRKVMQGSQGMPVGVQVSSYPLQEETVLNILGQIEKEVKFAEKYSPNLQ